MMMVHLFGIALGIGILFGGGELLVRGAVRIAKQFAIPSAVIGLTIVAYGTSMPELVVSVDAALSHSPDISLGNVVGSNIGNILLILGMTAVVAPIIAKRDMVVKDGGVMLACALLLWFLSYDGWLTAADGLLLIAGAVCYTLHKLRQGRKEGAAENPDDIPQEQKKCSWCAAGYVFIGLALLITGADILIDHSIKLARMLSVSEAVIGLTIVAIGTSTPEMITSLVAAYRKHHDISVGNIIGSNIFNILGILGVSASIAPIRVSPQFLNVEFWVLAATSVLALVFLKSGHKLSRLEGVVFVALFVAYIIYQYRFTGAA